MASFFFVFSESSETYSDASLNKIRAELNLLPKYFSKNPSSRNLNENFVKQSKKEIGKFILHTFQSNAHLFGTKNSNEPLLEGEGVEGYA